MIKGNVKVSGQAEENAEVMTIMPLGGGQEVGRSCILLQYQGRNVMLDCGCHPGREGSDGLPFFDSLDNPEDIDLILITHFHIDHCAALPYFTEKTNFKGRIFMTHATKAVMKLLLADNIRLQFKSSPLYSEQDLNNCIDKIEVVDYHQTIEHKGIKFTATAAGHVLGAAMFMIDIDSIKVLYTGDYSLEEDRHLIQASIPAGGPPDVLIVESTFGTTNIPTREKREVDFTNTVESIVRRGGSCLIPVFALGRAQELLLILDEYWRENAELQSVPVFYASKLATKSLRVYQTFINMMNNNIRDRMDAFRNPFKLNHIRSIQNNDFEVMGPSVVMASPGFMQSGVSRQLFEQWCDNEKNGVIIAGYTIEGTLANDLLSFPTEIKCMDNRIKPRRCQIEYIAFSAHVDGSQNKSFIKSIQPDYIILVHGEKTQMQKLRDSLQYEIKKNWSTLHKPSIASPENGVKVKLRFKKNIIANVTGSIATNLLTNIDSTNSNALITTSSAPLTPPVVSIPSKAILVTENFHSQLVSANELSTYTKCKFNRILQRMFIPVPQGLGFVSVSHQIVKSSTQQIEAEKRMTEQLLLLMIDTLEEIFDNIDIQSTQPVGGDRNSGTIANSCLIVEDLITLSPGYVTQSGREPLLSHVNIEWYASPISDTIADCVASSLMSLFSAQNALKMSMNNISNKSAAAKHAAAHGGKKRKTAAVNGANGEKEKSTNSTSENGISASKRLHAAASSSTVSNNNVSVDTMKSEYRTTSTGTTGTTPLLGVTLPSQFQEPMEEEEDEPLPLPDTSFTLPTVGMDVVSPNDDEATVPDIATKQVSSSVTSSSSSDNEVLNDETAPQGITTAHGDSVHVSTADKANPDALDVIIASTPSVAFVEDAVDAVLPTIEIKQEQIKAVSSSPVQSKSVREHYIDKMQSGDIDPSRAIPDELRALSAGHTNGTESDVRADNTTSNSNGNGTSGGEKLSNLLTLLEKFNETHQYFSTIVMNTTGDKLIFRSVPNKRYNVSDDGVVEMKPDKQKKTTVGAFDGFCFILFGGNDGEEGNGNEESYRNKHHAVVECANDGFRKTILLALSQIA